MSDRPSLKKDADGFTRMQRACLDAYLHGEPGVRFNKTRAAIAAGYSERTAYSIGHELTNKPHIRKAIRQNFIQFMQRVRSGEE